MLSQKVLNFSRCLALHSPIYNHISNDSILRTLFPYRIQRVFYCDNKSSNVQVQKSPITPLFKQLEARIKFGGPLTIHEYMSEVLKNPLSGYYTKKEDVFGSKGDYITSPDISQMFGELLGIWIYNEWHKMGKCTPLHIIEFGPGKGTLMQDILRTLKKVGVDSDSIKIHMVEISLQLANEQEKSICNKTTNNVEEKVENETGYYKKSTTSHGSDIHWYRHLVAVPKGFSMFLAHEFFDALPIHKLQKTSEGWRELLVDLDETNGPHHLRYVLSRHDTPISKTFISEDESRTEIEISPESISLISDISKRIEEFGGAALIVDYGHDGTLGDTFRAYRSHEQISPLSEPGLADLTADVDFCSLKKEAEKRLVCYGPVTQNFFLKNMGIEIRLMRLLQQATREEHKNLVSAYKMLTDPEKMGDRFKMFAIFPNSMKEFLVRYPPAGFFRSFLNEEKDDKNR